MIYKGKNIWGGIFQFACLGVIQNPGLFSISAYLIVLIQIIIASVKNCSSRIKSRKLDLKMYFFNVFVLKTIENLSRQIKYYIEQTFHITFTKRKLWAGNVSYFITEETNRGTCSVLLKVYFVRLALHVGLKGF